MKKLAVIIEGGIVQCIVSDTPEFFRDTEVLVIEYDKHGDEDNMMPIPQSDGDESYAYVDIHRVSKATIPLEEITQKIYEGDEDESE